MDIIEQLKRRIHSAEYRDAMINPPVAKPDPGPGTIVSSSVIFPDGTTQSLESYNAARRRELSIPNLATIQEVEQAEKLLGFPLPEIVRRLYLEVRNGGFGNFHHPILDIATVAREYVESLSSHERSLPEWPLRLLPICDWGCSIYSCVDCASAGTPVIRVDYNWGVSSMREEYVLTSDFQFFESYSNDEVAAWVESPTLENWFSDWLAGVNLFYQAYPPHKPKPVQ